MGDGEGKPEDVPAAVQLWLEWSLVAGGAAIGEGKGEGEGRKVMADEVY